MSMSNSIRIRRSSRADSKVNLIYEVLFDEKTPPDEAPEQLSVEIGQKLELRCLTEDGSLDADSMHFTTLNKELQFEKEEKIDKGISVPIEGFNLKKHAGIVECSVKYKKEKNRSITKRINFAHQQVLPMHVIPCEVNICHNGGVCGVEAKIEKCFCPHAFGGERCADPVVSDFIYRAAQVALGGSGVFLFALLALSVALGFLFLKERRKRRELLDYMDRSPPDSPLSPIQEESQSDVFNFSIENPYKETCTPQKAPKRKPPVRSEEVTSDSWWRRSMKRLRGGFRPHQNGNRAEGKMMIDPSPPQPPLS
ncbi:unnamed protein product, partial [Mesorhabditis belari]|uniref:EGF-like domain-containing protein n=1 Tax=Mesorhabditis belari TaxID=2138241 RepID=A0AAF3EYR9_9BILA